VKKKGYQQDPYRQRWDTVKIEHFKNSYLFDNTYLPGFEVQRWYAKKQYNIWLRFVRRHAGWGSFHRYKPPKEEDEK